MWLDLNEVWNHGSLNEIIGLAVGTLVLVIIGIGILVTIFRDINN